MFGRYWRSDYSALLPVDPIANYYRLPACWHWPLIDQQPELSIRLLELSMTKISAMQKQIQLLTLPKVEERLFKYLQMYANEIGQNSFVLPLKLKDLALYLGTTPETLSRKFALLEEQGRLRRKLRQIDLI